MNDLRVSVAASAAFTFGDDTPCSRLGLHAAAAPRLSPKTASMAVKRPKHVAPGASLGYECQ